METSVSLIFEAALHYQIIKFSWWGDGVGGQDEARRSDHWAMKKIECEFHNFHHNI